MRLEDGGGDLQDPRPQLARGLQGGLAADPGAAAGPGRAARGRRLGIAGQHPDAVAVEPHALGDDLADDRLAALALFGDADGAGHVARGRQLEDAPSCAEMRAPPTP